MIRYRLFIVLCLIVPAGLWVLHPGRAGVERLPASLRYVSIGDSYTIGQGAQPGQCWPALLAAHLTRNHIATELVANPAVTGWTTREALDRELPVFRQMKPDFATLLIGVNDYVKGVDAAIFRRQLVQLLDGMLAVLPRRRLVVITIPDFSVTPTGAHFADGRDASAGVAAFNAIIIQESRRRHVPIVDIFKLTQEMARDTTLIAPDGLHPSAKEYAKWEKLIYPVAARSLTP